MNDNRAEQTKPDAMSREAVERLHAVVARGHERWRRLVGLEAIGLAVAAPLAYLWLVFILDNVAPLSRWGRLGANALFWLVVGWLVWRLVQNWRRAHFTEDEVALAIERSTPTRLENRLINAIQLSRTAEGGRDAASLAVVLENYRYLQAVRLEQAAHSRPAVIRIALAAMVIVAGGLFYGFHGQRFTTAAARFLMPFAEIEPVYRTRLIVEPGDVEVEPGQDVVVRIRVEGELPASVAILRTVKGERTSVELPLRDSGRSIAYTFPSVVQPIAYAARGGDYVTRYYTITVPVVAQLVQVAAEYQFPKYTGRPSCRVETAGGDLEALWGTQATVTFRFSQPIESAAMLMRQSANGQVEAGVQRVPLHRISSTEFIGEIVFENVSGYRLETSVDGRSRVSERVHALRVLPDLPPELRLVGIESHSEVMPDAAVPVTLLARDDYGLEEVGLFFRPSGTAKGEATEPEWQELERWTVSDRAAAFERQVVLAIAAMNAVEGDVVELAARGRDADPRKVGAWSNSEPLVLQIGGIGVALQRQYEQILKSERELRELVPAQGRLEEAAAGWIRQLDPGSGLRWDDQNNLNKLDAGMKEQAAAQAELRGRTAVIAREMDEGAATVRLSLGMLADTEMVRCIRILETVPTRENPQAMRATLGEARLTQQRIVRSLRELFEQFVQFRQDWELAHMVSFTRMLAERQDRMRAESLTYAGLPPGQATATLPASTRRRQEKLLELSGLAQRVFEEMGQRTEVAGPILAKAFSRAAAAFDSTGLKVQMQAAAELLAAADWATAAERQEEAARALAQIHTDLIKVQAEAARKALAELQEAESQLEGQQDVRGLRPGSAEHLIDVDLDTLDLTEVIHLQEMAEEAKRASGGRGEKTWDYMFEEHMKAMLQTADTGKRQSIEDLTLATQPSGQTSLPNSSDRIPNLVKPHIQEQFDDLVGALLEEADDLRQQYETYNINAAFNISETGDVGKQGGDLNSTAAAAATGNMKPPTHDFGGASRSGRQGARAHGMVVGDESINRRGRDEAQESQEEVPDQPGKVKETMSDDPQADTATGVGGKEVRGGQPNTFSTKDAGEWKDEISERLKPPESTYSIVERQGKPFNPRIGELLRDLESTQEQVIERIKTIRKQLDNLYLPSGHLDEIAETLKANLERLKESPDAEVFRLQMETLDKLRGAIVVFNRPMSEFQPSIPRRQVLPGRVLDEPPWQTFPGYEEAVKTYYEKLVEP